jgi:hypothetical protein
VSIRVLINHYTVRPKCRYMTAQRDVLSVRAFAGYSSKSYNPGGSCPLCLSVPHEDCTGAGPLLSEQEVTRAWSQIFKTTSVENESFDRAEKLLDELRSESPLRLRLTHELEELRSIHNRREAVAARG